jgi:starch phosphorylase
MHFPDQSATEGRNFSNIQGHAAYFSMEIAILPSMPTYSGGLGVLAGDTLRSASDLGVPLAAVTLVHRKGYFRQYLDAQGQQTETEQPWNPEATLMLEEPRVAVTIEGRTVFIRAWRYDMEGVTGHTIPIYMLDTNLEENDPRDRALTDHLYGGDNNYRLAQEIVLGMGGARMLEALTYDVNVYHMNEGHAALLTVAVLEKQLNGGAFSSAHESDFEAVRRLCIFTTHTPVPAGHDRFSMEQAYRILGPETVHLLERVGGCHDGMLNMTYVAMRFSRFMNGVAMQHMKVSREMFPGVPIEGITNGVHAPTWTGPAMQELFDEQFPHWRVDNFQLRYAIDIAPTKLAAAHLAQKRVLFAKVKEQTGIELDEKVCTIGFARRVATYKRADLLFSDPARLAQMAEQFGGLQVLYGGKAHPHDMPGKQLIKNVFAAASKLTSASLHVIYLENYDWGKGALLTSGVDIWLNNPERPLEASGTSGMKAALNGVPSLSILDGWWIEGCTEGVTGWAIEDGASSEEEARNLYAKLENAVLPLYYRRRDEWNKMMGTCIAQNGSFFNTQRMLQQYLVNAYYPEKEIRCSVEELEKAFARVGK